MLQEELLRYDQVLGVVFGTIVGTGTLGEGGVLVEGANKCAFQLLHDLEILGSRGDYAGFVEEVGRRIGLPLEEPQYSRGWWKRQHAVDGEAHGDEHEVDTSNESARTRAI